MQSLRVILLSVLLLRLAACGKGLPAADSSKIAAGGKKPGIPLQVNAALSEEEKTDPSDVVKTIPLAGFDPYGEPEVRMLRNGDMEVVFNFMPPSFAQGKGEGRYENFDKDMSLAIGMPVSWEDREFFYIEKPHQDTLDRVRQFVATYHQKR